MKIFILFNHPAPYKVKLFDGLSDELDVHVIFERFKNKDRNPLFYDSKEYKFTLHQIKGLNIGNENHFSRSVIKHLKENKYDMIIINGYSTFTEMLTINYLKKHKIPYYFYINGGIVKSDNFFKFKIKQHFISGARGYFSPSKMVDDYLIRYGNAKEKNIYHYPYSTIYENQINTHVYSNEEKKAFFNNKGIAGNYFFVSVTTLSKRKNNILLLNTWINKPTDQVLILIGEGKQKNRFIKFIKKNKLSNVIILPFMERNKTLEYLAHAHGAIYVSNYDIYGHVINEALSSGTNVIASDKMMATRHLLKDGINGIIHHQDDDLSLQIEQLISKDFFTEAIKTAKENTIEKMVAAHVKIIKEIEQ